MLEIYIHTYIFRYVFQKYKSQIFITSKRMSY